MPEPTPHHPLLSRLARINKRTAFLATLLVLALALLAPPPFSGLLLLVLAAGLTAILVTTWPVQPAGTRVLRVAVLLLLVAAAAARLS